MNGRISRLLQLQFKIFAKAFAKFFIVLLLAVTCICAFAFYQLSMNDSKERIRVVVVEEKEDELFEQILPFVNSINSIKNFCKMELMDEESAIEGMKNGDIPLYIVVPANFMDDAIHMQDVQLTICVPKERSLLDKRIIALIEGIEQIMITTESSIWTIYDGMEYYTFSKGVHELEDDMMNIFMSSFFRRERLWNVEYLSMYGELSVIQYYISALCIFVILLLGIPVMSIQNKEFDELVRLIAVSKKEKTAIFLGSIVTIAIFLSFFEAVLMGIMNSLMGYFGIDGISFSILSLILMLFMNILISLYIRLLMLLRGSSIHKGIIYILMTATMGILSGLAGSKYYLPEIMKHVAGMWPMAQWHGMFNGVIWGVDAGINLIFGLLTGIVIGVVGIFVYFRELEY